MRFTRPSLFELWRSRAVIYAVGGALPVGVTLAGPQLALPAFAFEHLMVVLVVALAVAGAIGPAVAGVIGDKVLLREPIGRPAITGVRDAVDLGLLLGVVRAECSITNSRRESVKTPRRFVLGERPCSTNGTEWA